MLVKFHLSNGRKIKRTVPRDPLGKQIYIGSTCIKHQGHARLSGNVYDRKNCWRLSEYVRVYHRRWMDKEWHGRGQMHTSMLQGSPNLLPTFHGKSTPIAEDGLRQARDGSCVVLLSRQQKQPGKSWEDWRLQPVWSSQSHSKQQGHLETLSFSCWNWMRNNIITVEVLGPDMSWNWSKEQPTFGIEPNEDPLKMLSYL